MALTRTIIQCLLWCLSFELALSACSQKSFPISFLCDNPTAEIYVDGGYIGSGGPISYTVPAGCKQVNVECIVDGVRVFSRTYNVEGQKNMLFDIHIPQNMQYHTN